MEVLFAYSHFQMCRLLAVFFLSPSRTLAQKVQKVPGIEPPPQIQPPSLLLWMASYEAKRCRSICCCFFFFYECHRLTDNLLGLWDSQEEEEKVRDIQDNVHRIGTQDVSSRGRVPNASEQGGTLLF